MKEIIEYQLATGDEEAVIDNVNRMIGLGWVPFGGVAVASNDTEGTVWSQAMVIYRDAS